MTWKEIKKAVEEAGVEEDEEIGLIQCENGDGDHTFHKVRLDAEVGGKRHARKVARAG